VASVILVSLLPSAHAQQEADEKYIAIYGVVQQAENLADTGEPKQALASLTDAQTQLQTFQKIYPDWNPAIITYRLDDLAKKIATINAKLAAMATPPSAPAVTEAAAGPPNRRRRKYSCGRNCSPRRRKTRPCRPSSRRRWLRSRRLSTPVNWPDRRSKSGP